VGAWSGPRINAPLVSSETERGTRFEARAVLGDAAAVLQGVADEGGAPTLVAVGSRGLNAVRRAVLCSVSTDVLRAVSGPVLIVSAPDEP
jgi:nucleotide-binding universal stress UspA family protein